MSKILLIIQREYLSRVKKRSFLLLTFLLPLFFAAVFAAILLITKKSLESQHATVRVIDYSGFVANQLHNNPSVTFIPADGDISSEKDGLLGSDGPTYLLIVPEKVAGIQNVELFSSTQAGVLTQNEISNQIENILRSRQLEAAGIDPDILQHIRPSVTVSAKELTAEGEKDTHAGLTMGIAIGLSIIIYVSLFLYGSQVMRGIIEEKNNRIVEVIISSVKPFQLMMGKIIGIGLVGITQFLLWIILSTALMSVAGALLPSPGETSPAATATPSVIAIPDTAQQQDVSGNSAVKALAMLDKIDVTRMVVYFFLFFISGYLLYSALFAAVGSAVDSETETQQFMFPITMPLLFTYILSFSVLINNPHGSVALWLSMIPFTSPIAMLVRIPFGVPEWQIILSLLLLVAGFIGTTWTAGRIYRVGILMYGKKASYRELIKWFRYRG